MSRGKFSNKAAKNFLAELPVTSVESTKLVRRTKFNFSFLDLEQPKNLAQDLTKEFFDGLFKKLKHFSAEPLAYWDVAPVGRKDGNYLEIYGAFPKRSDFKHPAFVPHDAIWCRFRISSSVRLAGFTVPSKYNHQLCEDERYRFCTNTFYIVFIDLEHGFYKTK